MTNGEQIIHIHPQAPAKPAMGQPCNGCGVCCAAEPCPVSLTLLWPHAAPCRALTWDDDTKRYLCGMVSAPSQQLSWLPKRLDKIAGRLFKRWIAADTNCDAAVVIEQPRNG